MMRYWKYFMYVVMHKWFVLLEGLKLNVPLWMLILHDWDKFLPDEFVPYARTFYKPDGTKQYAETVEFARAWMLHQHRNKHHWQYWLWVDMQLDGCSHRVPDTDYLVWDRGEAQRVVYRRNLSREWYELHPVLIGDIVGYPDPMPDVYRSEMLADWRGAGRALGKPDTLAWYTANKDKMKLHTDTRAWIEQQIGYKP